MQEKGRPKKRTEAWDQLEDQWFDILPEHIKQQWGLVRLGQTGNQKNKGGKIRFLVTMFEDTIPEVNNAIILVGQMWKAGILAKTNARTLRAKAKVQPKAMVRQTTTGQTVVKAFHFQSLYNDFHGLPPADFLALLLDMINEQKTYDTAKKVRLLDEPNDTVQCFHAQCCAWRQPIMHSRSDA